MDDFDAYLDALTLDEQAALTAGSDDWHTTALPERGIPRLKTTDGPAGARGESYTTTTSASFPCGSALGATFDPELVERVGAAIADEALTKSAHVLLAPTLNLHRHPLGGRNFESYGEDPLLVARIGAGFITGVQSRGVAACAKHFVANDAELERLTISSDVDERTLREVYLLPFEVAVRDAGVWTVMASYNRLNGDFACEHRWLLTELLRDEWGFDGLVVSDWFATHDTVASALAGLDLEMPGPARAFGPPLAEAVRAGSVPAAVVRAQAHRVLALLDRTGAGDWSDETERSEDDADRWALAREAAAAAMVLLRNAPVDGSPVLPLDPAALRRIAVVGPNADVAVIQGGGSARVTPHRTVSPLEGLRARLPDVEIVHAVGATRGDLLPPLDGRVARVDGRPGIRFDYRRAEGGEVLLSSVLPRLDPVWAGRFSPAVHPRRFHVTATATLRPERTGPHQMDLSSVGPCMVLLDGTVLLDNRSSPVGSSFFGMGRVPVRATVHLDAGTQHEIEVRYDRPDTATLGGLRVGFQGPIGDDPIGDAARLAADADVAVVVVGTDGDWETEGEDRTTMALPGAQDALVRAVAAAHPRTVVVVNAGAAVDMPWASSVAAVVVTWFPGMAGGEALAAVLAGDEEPSGRLPFTVPATVADAPCDISRADPPGHLRYTEGRLVGHRWYLTKDIAPQHWFGAGGSYSTFEWGTPVVGEPLVIVVPVTNTGRRAGSEVVQAYVYRPGSLVERPVSVLAGMAKVRIDAGTTVSVVVRLDDRVLRHWDAGWHLEPGRAEVRLARSAGDPGTVVTIDIPPA